MLLEGILALAFGFSTDFADLLDEHGLKWFRGADIAWGVAWGLAGSLMMVVYHPASILIVGLLLYWIAVKKIDYLNHQIAAVIILFTAGWQIYRGEFDFILTGVYFLLCLAFGLFNSFLKKKYGLLPFVSIRHYIPALLLSVYTGNWNFVLIHILTMAGFTISDRWFLWFEKKKDFGYMKDLGLRIEK